ncbi:hypothetical protein KW797_00500 [Candidatus Parcubacteria bacterium]|nr:hypothetical protein [Candidatus Parcubacteria bacterium]
MIKRAYNRIKNKARWVLIGGAGVALAASVGVTEIIPLIATSTPLAVFIISEEQVRAEKIDTILATPLIGTYLDATWGNTIEIVEVRREGTGLVLYAKAWKDATPIGFGRDGSIEIERFIFQNPILDIHLALANAVHDTGKVGKPVLNKVGRTTSVVTTYTDPPNASTRVGDASANKYQAQQFIADLSGTVTSIKFYMRIIDGTPTDGVVVEVWTDNGSDSPGSFIVGATATIAQASIVDGANSWSSSEFSTATPGTPPTVVNGTKYWVVMYRFGAIDAVNYNNMWVDDPSSIATILHKISSDGTSWSASDNDQTYDITITGAAASTSPPPMNEF